LPELLRPTILLCESDGRPVAGVAISMNGETAVTWLLASNSEGRKCYAAYLVQWEALKMLKEQGCRTYDLGGGNPAGNPDTYLFKARMVGRKPEVSPRVGIFDACKNPVSWLAVRSVEVLGSLRRRLESRRRKEVDVADEGDDVHYQRR
jgi:lipid II:glycine glycyltransferase (peptidoglycan interpeptide bridge formation enzyme)